MSFLAGLVSDIVLAILSKLESWGLAWWKTKQAEDAVSSQAQTDKTNLENAKTEGDKTNAATAINSDTFGSGPSS